MKKSRNIKSLLCGSVFFTWSNPFKQQLEYDEKFWTDYTKCSQNNLLIANKKSVEEYTKLRTYCTDSLLKFRQNTNDEIKIQLQLKNPNEFSKSPINDLDYAYSHYKTLSLDNVATLESKNHFIQLLKLDMESNCKSNKKISFENYKKKYSFFPGIVELVYLEVGEKYIRCIDMDIDEIIKLSSRLAIIKINYLFADALFKNDTYIMHNLINKYYEFIYLSTIAKKLKNKYLIDVYFNKFSDKPHYNFSCGEISEQIYVSANKRIDVIEARQLLLFASCYYNNTSMMEYMTGLKAPHFLSRDINYYVGAIAFSYQNDDYDLFVKYCTVLQKFPDYTKFFCSIRINTGSNFQQKNNYLELIKVYTHSVDTKPSILQHIKPQSNKSSTTNHISSNSYGGGCIGKK